MRHPFSQDMVEMAFIQRNHKIQTVSVDCVNDPFTDGIRHWRPHGCFEYPQSHIPDTLVDWFGENRIPIMDQDAIRVIGWNGCSELLHGPLSRGVCRHIDVKESAAGMFNHHKDIQNAKRRGDRHTEVTGHDTLGVITDERRPAIPGGP